MNGQLAQTIEQLPFMSVPPEELPAISNDFTDHALSGEIIRHRLLTHGPSSEEARIAEPVNTERQSRLGRFFDRFSLNLEPLRNRRIAQSLAMVALAGGASGLIAKAANGEVTSSGYQYNPSALAQDCVEDVGDGFSDPRTGGFAFETTIGNPKHIIGEQSVTINTLVKTMRSRLWDSDGVRCPGPAGETVKARILFQVATLIKRGKQKVLKMKYVPATPWATIVQDTTEGTPPDPEGNNPGWLPVTFNFFKDRVYQCFPHAVQSLLRRQAIKANPSVKHPVVGRWIGLQVNTTSHSAQATETKSSPLDTSQFPMYFYDDLAACSRRQ